MDPDGENQTRLTHNVGGDTHPSWSLDGQRIAFVSQKDFGDGDIYVMDADGDNQKRLTRIPLITRNPSWSPDGRRIAFDAFTDLHLEIFVMDSDGSKLKKLTDNLVLAKLPLGLMTGVQSHLRDLEENLATAEYI